MFALDGASEAADRAGWACWFGRASVRLSGAGRSDRAERRVGPVLYSVDAAVAPACGDLCAG